MSLHNLRSHRPDVACARRRRILMILVRRRWVSFISVGADPLVRTWPTHDDSYIYSELSLYKLAVAVIGTGRSCNASKLVGRPIIWTSCAWTRDVRTERRGGSVCRLPAFDERGLSNGSGDHHRCQRWTAQSIGITTTTCRTCLSHSSTSRRSTTGRYWASDSACIIFSKLSKWVNRPLHHWSHSLTFELLLRYPGVEYLSTTRWMN